MKMKLFLFLALLSLAGYAQAQEVLIDDFEGSKQTYILTWGGGNVGGAEGLVTYDPLWNDGNHALRALCPSNSLAELSVSLPAGKKLGDYKAIQFDLMIIDYGDGNNIQLHVGRWNEGSAPGRYGPDLLYNVGRKGEFVQYGWKTLQVPFSAFNTNTGNVPAKMALEGDFKILLGFGTNGGRFFMDNVKLIP
jgi:hypothetical protein